MYQCSRQYDYDGLAQNVAVPGGARYKLSAHIKLLNLENGSLYQNVDLIMLCLDAKGESLDFFYRRSYLNYTKCYIYPSSVIFTHLVLYLHI